MVYVRLADKSTRGVPAWMFDPVVCSTVRLAETPLIECGALAGLAVLLAHHGVLRENGINRTLRAGTGSEGAQFPCSGLGQRGPEVIAAQIDVLPTQRWRN